MGSQSPVTMSLLWTSLYGLLCGEVLLLSLLQLPYISTHVWCNIVTRGRWVYAWLDPLLGITWYFWVLVTLLALVFCNCLVEMTKYEDVKDMHKEATVDAMTRHMDSINVFRTQRNVYISGLTLFLALVIKRVLSLILKLGKVRNQREQLRKNSSAPTKKEKKTYGSKKKKKKKKKK